MSEKNEKAAAGKALYLEFRKEDYIYQFILTPTLNAINPVDEPYAPQLMMRRISTWHPKRNWSFVIGKNVATPRNADGTLASTNVPSELVDLMEKQSADFKGYANQLASRGYTLKNPVFVEVSYKDLDSIKSRKTPNDLYRRILRSREALGLGELISEKVAV